jgi:glycerol-3-phosphate dehydrogenase
MPGSIASYCEKVARLLAKELDHDEAWTQNQIAEFKTIANSFYI